MRGGADAVYIGTVTVGTAGGNPVGELSGGLFWRRVPPNPFRNLLLKIRDMGVKPISLILSKGTERAEENFPKRIPSIVHRENIHSNSRRAYADGNGI